MSNTTTKAAALLDRIDKARDNLHSMYVNGSVYNLLDDLAAHLKGTP